MNVLTYSFFLISLQTLAQNYFELLANEQINTIAEQLVVLSPEQKLLPHCRNFLKTCKRFTAVGHETFINQDKVLEAIKKSGKNISSLYVSFPAQTIHIATGMGATRWLQKTLKQNKNLVHCHQNKYSTTTPLHWAVIYNQLACANILLDHGADCNAANHCGLIPFAYIDSDQKLPMAQFLLEHGTKVNTTTPQGLSLLHLAIEMRAPLVAKLLLNQSDLNVNAQTTDKKTPLHFAARQNMVDIITLLIKEGAHQRSEDSLRCIPLHDAIMNNATQAALVLLQKGSPAWWLDSNYATALHGAAYMNNTDIMRALLGHGIVIDARDIEGKTPLHWAVINNSLEACKFLLAIQANSIIQDKQGKRPLDYAQENYEESNDRDTLGKIIFFFKDAERGIRPSLD